MPGFNGGHLNKKKLNPIPFAPEVSELRLTLEFHHTVGSLYKLVCCAFVTEEFRHIFNCEAFHE